jgi:hypothetical protein
MPKWAVISWCGRVVPIRRGGKVLPLARCQFLLLHPRAKFVLDWLPRKGLHVSARLPLSAVGLDRSQATAEWDVPSMKKKAGKTAEGEGSHLAPVETEYMKDLLPLVEHCCCRKYDDGDPREPGWITIRTVGSAWQVQVKDPDSGMSFAAVGATIDKALETAALLLGCDEAPWEHDQWLKKRKPPKKA